MRIQQIVAFVCRVVLFRVSMSVACLAALPDSGDVVGVHRLSLASGPNFVSLPLHGAAAFRGVVQSVSASGMTVSVDPVWAADSFGPRDGFTQYIVLVRTDASESPGIQGDWWPVQSNGADNLTVGTRGEDLSTLLAAGDEVEVRRLTSLKDLFGSGATLKLNPDLDFDVLTTQEDVIRFIQGVSFSGEVFYHQGTPSETGYYFNGSLLGTGDGSTITLMPGEPILVWRKAGSNPLAMLLSGSVLKTRFTHYLGPGPNAVGAVYPVPSPLALANLHESGWVSDENFDVLTSEEDIIRAVNGTSFGEEVFHHAGPVDAAYGWYASGEFTEVYSFQPTRGYIFFVSGSSTLRWRQNPALEP